MGEEIEDIEIEKIQTGEAVNFDTVVCAPLRTIQARIYGK